MPRLRFPKKRKPFGSLMSELHWNPATIAADVKGEGRQGKRRLVAGKAVSLPRCLLSGPRARPGAKQRASSQTSCPPSARNSQLRSHARKGRKGGRKTDRPHGCPYSEFVERAKSFHAIEFLGFPVHA